MNKRLQILMDERRIKILEDHKGLVGTNSLTEVLRHYIDLVKAILEADTLGEEVNLAQLLDLAFPFRPKV